MLRRLLQFIVILWKKVIGTEYTVFEVLISAMIFVLMSFLMVNTFPTIKAASTFLLHDFAGIDAPSLITALAYTLSVSFYGIFFMLNIVALPLITFKGKARAKGLLIFSYFLFAFLSMGVGAHSLYRSGLADINTTHTKGGVYEAKDVHLDKGVQDLKESIKYKQEVVKNERAAMRKADSTAASLTHRLTWYKEGSDGYKAIAAQIANQHEKREYARQEYEKAETTLQGYQRALNVAINKVEEGNKEAAQLHEQAVNTERNWGYLMAVLLEVALGYLCHLLTAITGYRPLVILDANGSQQARIAKTDNKVEQFFSKIELPRFKMPAFRMPWGSGKNRTEPTRIATNRTEPIRTEPFLNHEPILNQSRTGSEQVRTGSAVQELELKRPEPFLNEEESAHPYEELEPYKKYFIDFLTEGHTEIDGIRFDVMNKFYSYIIAKKGLNVSRNDCKNYYNRKIKQ